MVRVRLGLMADRVGVCSPEDFSQRQGPLTVPVVVATCLGLAMLVLGVGQWLLAEVLFHSGQLGISSGVDSISPSASEKVSVVFQHVWPVVVGVGLLVLTWRLRGQGLPRATWVAAVASVAVCAAAFPW